MADRGDQAQVESGISDMSLSEECPEPKLIEKPEVSNESISDAPSPIDEVLGVAGNSVQFLQSVQMKQLGGGGGGGGDKAAPRRDSVKYNPGPLSGGAQLFVDIQRNLESIILQSCEDTLVEKQHRNRLKQLDDVGQIVVASHALAAYISTLDLASLRKVTTHIVSDTGLWIARLFRFFDSAVYFHDEAREGLLRVCRMVLHAKYPKLATDGYEAVYPKPPVIYVSTPSRSSLGHYLCSQLGLPLSSLRVVPCSTLGDSYYKMNIAVLEKFIEEDLAKGKVPAIIVANAGSPSVGQIDVLHRLQEICKQHEMWLHLEGHSLAALCLVSVPNLPARTGDSMTLPLGTWLGVPSLPYITLYKTAEAPLVHAAGLSSFSIHSKLQCLPLWVGLQSLGHQGVVQRILHCFRLSELLIEKLESFPRINIVGKQRIISKEGQVLTLNDVLTKSVSTVLLFDIVVPVAVFQYVPEKDSTLTEEVSQEKEVTKNPPYYNSLNSWLGQVLNRDVPTVTIDLLDIEHHGVCLRFCPLENAHVVNTTVQDIEDFHNCLLKQLTILNSTVHQKAKFQEALLEYPSLMLVEICNWAGLGGVRYIPDAWVDRLNELTDSGKEEINRLNSELVIKLKNSDSAFSLGEGDDGMYCVRFGMVTEDLGVDVLIGLVLNAGQELEESSRALETMSELVRQGIEEANRGLAQENEEKVLQEGLLRHVPIVGSFFNWWAPANKEPGVKGRSFSISSGVVESTENIYKYHMQIQQGINMNNPPCTPPPQARVIVSSKRDSGQHSRSSSRSSQPGGVPPTSSNKTTPVSSPTTSLPPETPALQ